MVGVTLFRTKFKVRVLYKSGNQQEFWCTEFNVKNGHWTWNAVTQTNNPIMLGVDDVEAVWQVGGRLNIFTALKQLIVDPIMSTEWR